MTKTILTVDDSLSIRQAVKLTLRSVGYNVLEADSGRAALELLAGNRIDMVLTDLNMPEMDGIELIRNLRAKPAFRFVPIVMLTTESQQEKKAAGKAAGATGWITKPFTAEQFIAVVKKLCPP